MTARKRAPLVVSSLVTKAGHFVTDQQSLLLHAGLFVLILLTGIARYGRAMPPNPIILMTLWSIGLALHGALVYRVQRAATAGRDGILSAVALATTVNGVMWGMWMLALEARDPTVWHVSMLLAMLVLGVVGVIGGKRLLYRHWLKAQFDDAGAQKPKRDRQARLTDDGEYEDDVWLDEDEVAIKRER